MQEPIFKREDRIKILKKWGSAQTLNDTVLLKKFDKLLLWLPALLAVLASILISQTDYKIGILLIIGLISLPIVILTIFDVSFGLVLILILSFLINFIGKRLDSIPVGVIMDLLVVLSFSGILLRQIRNRNWKYAKNKITVAVLIWIGYCFLEVANPFAASKLAWVFTIRSMAGLMIVYFIAIFAIDSIKSVNRILYVWLTFAVLGTFYGLYQEYFGMPSYDLAWIMADRLRIKLLYNWGHFRVFSFFSDPTVFGLMMAYTGVFCLALAMGPLKTYKKFILLGISLTMFLAMVYTGTRTAYVILPLGVLFYSILTFQRNILIFTGIFVIFGLILIFGPFNSLGPISSNSLNRLRSAFSPTDDNSYKAREKNQAFIKPFIQRHPIGAGLGSVGVNGARFSPNSEIARFPPDSGYVRVAVELGWIGLIIYCYLFYTILRTGIENYYASRHPKIKNYTASILVVVFMLVVANFPQQAVNNHPTILLFYICMALLTKLRNIEEDELKIEK